MILRILTARVPDKNIGTFNDLLRAQLAELREQPGLVYVKLARRLEPDGSEEVVLIEEWRTSPDLFAWTRGRLNVPRLLPGTEELVQDLIITHYEALDVTPEDLSRRVLGESALASSGEPGTNDEAESGSLTARYAGHRRQAAPCEKSMPFTQLLDPIPIPLVFVLFAIVSMLAYEVGFRLGRWYQERTPGEQEGPTSFLVGSILALLAFLLAVTMGMASDRFDARRGVVLEEANAIGTTYLRAGYLPEPASSQIRELLREYVPLRIVATERQPRRGHPAVRGDPATDLGDHRGRRQDHDAGRPHLDLHRIAQRDDRPARDPDHGRSLRARARDRHPPADLRVCPEPPDGRLQRGSDGAAQPVECHRPGHRPRCGASRSSSTSTGRAMASSRSASNRSSTCNDRSDRPDPR